MSATPQVEKRGFETEVKQLLDLVIHSLYSNAEIFLRELVSNASDANDKCRFAALDNDALYEGNSELAIYVNFDEKAQTITVKDTGIGMTREEAIEHLGTIAKSGTKAFLSNLKQDQLQDSNLIGQFGVGFYATFIVADKVTVVSRKAGTSADEAVRWISDGKGEFSVETVTKPERGTEITLHLKEDAKEFLDLNRLKGVITKYSDHISWPVYLPKAPEFDEEGKEKPVQAGAVEQANRATALWTMNKSDIKPEAYHEFYKHISHDFDDPMLMAHNHVEGKQHYISLLYIPSHAPFDLFQQEHRHGLRLYVKRVFIMDDAQQLLPRYLRFVKGVIDSSDLPLNVSREILQNNKLIDGIRSANIKRILGLLEKCAKNDPEKYQKFWDTFGLVLKEGPIEDFSNREQIAKLLRFATTQSDSSAQTVSIDDYISRMKEDQEKIYYITAGSYNAAKHSPHLEIFEKQGIEVLLLSDKVDEWMMNHLGEVSGKTFQAVTKGDLDIPKTEEEDETVSEEDKAQRESVITQVKKVLGEKIKDARLTHRLTSSPACVVSDTHDMGLEMQRILKMAGQEAPEVKPILELNPEHPLFHRLESEANDQLSESIIHLLLEQAILAEGGTLDDPAAFVKRMNTLLVD